MESENVVIKTKDFLDKYGLLEGTSFTFEKDENIVRIKCGKALWDLVRYSSYKAEFSDLSRAMKNMKIWMNIQKGLISQIELSLIRKKSI